MEVPASAVRGPNSLLFHGQRGILNWDKAAAA